jgi:hypothetical protein
MVFDAKGQAKESGMQFCGNVISYYKNKMLLHLGYQYDGNGRAGVPMCLKAHP